MNFPSIQRLIDFIINMTMGEGGQERRERRCGEEKKRRKRESKKKNSGEKAEAKNVAEKRGWTKESAAGRKVGKDRPRLELELSRRLEGKRYSLV